MISVDDAEYIRLKVEAGRVPDLLTKIDELEHDLNQEILSNVKFLVQVSESINLNRKKAKTRLTLKVNG